MVPNVGGGLTGECLQQLLELLRSEVTRQTSASTGSDFGYRVGQRDLASPRQRQKLEKGTKGRSDKLETDRATSFGFARDIGQQIMRRQSLELKLKSKLLAVFSQEVAHGVMVITTSGYGQSSTAHQMPLVFFNESVEDRG
jgi:hypothetical protein